MAEGETIIVVSIPIEVQNLEAATAGFEALQAQLDGLDASGPVVSEALSGIGASAAGIDAVAGSFGGATDAAAVFGSAVEADTAQVGSLAAASTELATAQSASTGTTEALVAGLTAQESAAAQAAASNASLSGSMQPVAAAATEVQASFAGLETQIGALAAGEGAFAAAAASLEGPLAAQATTTAALSAADESLVNALRLQADAEIAVSQGENLAAAAARLHASALTAEDAQVVTLTANLNAEAAAAEKSAVGMDTAGASATAAGSSAMLGVGAFAALGAAAISASASFEAAMSHSESFAGASHAEVESMSQDILALSSSTGVAAKDLADGLYYVESAGYKGSDALKVLTASAQMAAASGADLKTVADGATSLMNAFHMTADQTGQAMDIMAATVSAGKMTLDDYSRSVGTSAAVAAAFGISAQEMGASVAELTSKGVSARLAFTTFNSELQGLEKPTAGAQKAMADLGLSVEQVRSELQSKGLLATYQDLVERTNGNTTALEQLIPNFRALRGVLEELGPAGNDYVRIQEQITNSTGTAAHANEVYSQTSQAAISKMKASMMADLIELGSGGAMALNPLLETLTKLNGAATTNGGGSLLSNIGRGLVDQLLPGVEVLRAVNAGVDQLGSSSQKASPAVTALSQEMAGQDAILIKARQSQQDKIAADNAEVASTDAVAMSAKQLATIQKEMDTGWKNVETSIRAEGVAATETADKHLAAITKEVDATQKYVDVLTKANNDKPDPAVAAEMDHIRAETDLAREALTAMADAKTKAFAPSAAEATSTNLLKEYNAELLIQEQNMARATKGSDDYNDAAARVSDLKGRMIPQLKEENAVVDAAVQSQQAYAKQLFDGQITVDQYNQHLDGLIGNFKNGLPAGLTESMQASYDYQQAQIKASSLTQQSADDIHALVTGLGFVAPATGDATTGLASIGKGFDDAATHAKDMGTGVTTALSTMASDVGTAQGTVVTAMTALGTNAGTTQTTMSTALTTIGTDMGVLAFTTQTQTAAINAALQTSSTAATVTATGFGLSSAAMASSLSSAGVSMAGTANQINSSLDTISARAAAVHGEVDAQLSTLGQADIGPAGANGQAIGAALDQGVMAGVMAGAGAVAAAASDMVTNAINAAKAAGAIQSPSAVMRDQVGAMLTEGVVEGMDSRKPKVVAAGEAIPTTAAAAVKSKKPVFVDAMVDLVTGIDVYGLGTKAGNDAAQGIIDGISAGMKAQKGEHTLASESAQIDSGRVKGDGTLLTPEEVNNLRAEADTAKGIFDGLASSASAAWARVEADVVALNSAIGVAAQKAAEEQLKLDTQIAEGATSAANTAYTTWKDSNAAIVADAKQAAQEQIAGYNAQSQAYRAMLNDDKAQRHLDGTDARAAQQEVTAATLASDAQTREQKRALAVDALAHTREIDAQLVQAADDMNAAIGTSDYAQRKVTYDGLKEQSQMWHSYTTDVTGDYDEATKQYIADQKKITDATKQGIADRKALRADEKAQEQIDAGDKVRTAQSVSPQLLAIDTARVASQRALAQTALNDSEAADRKVIADKAALKAETDPIRAAQLQADLDADTLAAASKHEVLTAALDDLKEYRTAVTQDNTDLKAQAADLAKFDISLDKAKLDQKIQSNQTLTAAQKVQLEEEVKNDFESVTAARAAYQEQSADAQRMTMAINANTALREQATTQEQRDMLTGLINMEQARLDADNLATSAILNNLKKILDAANATADGQIAAAEKVAQTQKVASGGGSGSAPAGQISLGDILLKGGLVNGLLASALGGPAAGAFNAVPQTNPGAAFSVPGISGPAGSVSTSTSGGGSTSSLNNATGQLVAAANQILAAANRLASIQQQPINLGLGGAMTQIQQLAPALVGMR